MLSQCRIIVIACICYHAIAAHATAATITGLTLSPTEATVGATVTAVAQGTGPCGAVHIEWGDGPGITYATARLPVSQTHVYGTPGTYQVRARGMGNCDGEAGAQVVVRDAPAAAARLTSVDVAPSAAALRAPVSITVQGSGACTVAVGFGDGTTQEVTGTLPLVLKHEYSRAGTYEIVARPSPPCASTQRARLVVASEDAASLTSLQVSVGRRAAPAQRIIEVGGRGRCSYAIDYGDGSSDTRSTTLPDTLRHNYPKAGRYTIVASAQPPCFGTQRATIEIGSTDVAPQPGSLAGLRVTPQVVRPGQPVDVTIAGTGTCRVTVDFDDGESRTVTEALPHRLTYRYAQPGDFEIRAWANEPCRGEADALIRVQGRR